MANTNLHITHDGSVRVDLEVARLVDGRVGRSTGEAAAAAVAAAVAAAAAVYTLLTSRTQMVLILTSAPIARKSAFLLAKIS